MIKLVKSNPPIFEFQLTRENQTLVVVKLKAMYWYQYDESARQDKLQTSIDRFSFCKNLDQWIGIFEYQQLDEWEIEFKKLVGNDDGLVSRGDLLKYYGIKNPALIYRINEMGHPKPIKIGRKHWFNVDECDRWIATLK